MELSGLLVMLSVCLGAFGAGALGFWATLRAIRRDWHRRTGLFVGFVFALLITCYIEALGVGYWHAHLPNRMLIDRVEVEYPLTGGYELLSSDVFPENASIGKRAPAYEPAVSNVRAVQIAGDLLLVTSYETHDAKDPGWDKPGNRYFVIDTKSSTVKECATIEALGSYATSHGVSLRLKSTEEFRFNDQPPQWISWLILSLILVFLITPPGILTIWWLRRWKQLSRGSTALQSLPSSL